VNNSAIHPQFSVSDLTPVRNLCRSSTACVRPNTRLTRAFVDSSPIHTPYYDYLIGFTTKSSKRKGMICAYPS